MGAYTHHADHGTVSTLPIQDKHIDITRKMKLPMPVVVASRIVQHMRPVRLGKLAILMQKRMASSKSSHNSGCVRLSHA